jgi:type II secretory pathway component GspD/PulD (secretin)
MPTATSSRGIKWLWLALLLAAGAAWAQTLEIITLKYQTAEQVLPQLRPLLEPGAGITGAGNKLFLRSSPRNKQDILRVLEVIDREPRRLLISVRQEGQADLQGAGTLYGSRGVGSDNVSQQVQTIEGGRAFIQAGRSQPVPVRQVVNTPRGPVVTESVVYQDSGTGFYAVPRLSGSIVTLDISPSHDTPGRVPGSIEIQEITTTVTGRLGEWISLGGSTLESNREQSGTLGYSSRSALSSRQVWLKVEELP